MLFEPRKLRACLFALRSAGLDPETVLRGGPLSWQSIEAIDEIDGSRMAAAMELIAERAGEAMGFYCGTRARMRDYGAVGMIVQTSYSFREALDAWTQHGRVSGHPMAGELVHSPEGWRYYMRPIIPLSHRADRFWANYSVAGTIAVYREITGRADAALDIGLPYDTPPQLELADETMFRRIVLGSSGPYFGGTPEELTACLIHSDSAVRDLCEANLPRLATKGCFTMQESVRAVLDRRGRLPCQEEVAEILGITVDDLTAALQRENCAFRSLVNRYRRDRAEAMLRGQTLRVKEMSRALGYSDPSGFRRAYRKWSGQAANVEPDQETSTFAGEQSSVDH